MANSRNQKPGEPAAAYVRQVKPIGFVVGAKTVGSFVPKLTQKAFERFGFPAAAILTDWAGIVGPDLASYTRPEKLKWPRNNAPDGEDGETEPAGGQAAGATLVLRVDGPRAIEIQYRGPQLLERINAYFGFRAITELRILQAPVTRPAARPARPAVHPRPPAATARPREAIGLATRDDNPLAAALERLGSAVASRQGRAG